MSVEKSNFKELLKDLHSLTESMSANKCDLLILFPKHIDPNQNVEVNERLKKVREKLNDFNSNNRGNEKVLLSSQDLEEIININLVMAQLLKFTATTKIKNHNQIPSSLMN